MAKKKKKTMKLNGQIRSFFGGEPFDEGVVRVPTETLVAMAHHIGIFDGTTNKESLIKIFRRLWSQEEDDNRELIVDFFIHNEKRYPNPQPREKPHEKRERIDELLANMELSKEEYVALLESFDEVRTRKITPEKIASKLEHIRFVSKRATLEKALDGKFDYNDALEFYASIIYEIGDEKFSKIHVLKTAQLDSDTLRTSALDDLVVYIQTLKTKAHEAKQAQISAFLGHIKLDSHRYLKRSEIISALKGSPPSNSNMFFPLTMETLQRILPSQAVGLEFVGDELLIEYSQAIVLPYRDEPLMHTAHIQLSHYEIAKLIWEESDLVFDEQFEIQGGQIRRVFLGELDALVQECAQYAKLLGLTNEQLYALTYDALLPYLHESLHISAKIQKRTLFAFERAISHELLKKQRQQLLARTVRDFKNLFPLARSLRRRLIFHTGPTNSGKTYTAMEALRQAGTGYYLAPLRLLALEGYEELRERGVSASLITGEEQIVDEDATHISSTIEMLSFESEVDVCVIDEVQMIGDRDRGWAWANAIIGAPAKTVIMTGSDNAREAVEALARYLGEPLEIVEFERKNPLELMPNAVSIDNIQPQSAIIAFTRSNALRLKQQLSKTYATSIIYGNLSPEVRREEARRFREGETQVLVATDAIAMGLNLPIKTILFSKADKFDGQNQRDLTPSEVHQISGRAGRYGMEEKGFVGALDNTILKKITAVYTKSDEVIKIPFNVMANFDHVQLVSTILEEKSLSNIIEFFVDNMTFEGPFVAINLESMGQAAAIVDKFDLDMRTKYILSTAPLSTRSPIVMGAYERYVRALAQAKPIAYIPPRSLGAYAQTTEELQDAEDQIKEISLYLWLSYRLGEFFVDSEKARNFRGELNRFIENSLKQSHFVPRCKTCSKPLAIGSEFSICQSCFVNLNRAKRGSKEGDVRRSDPSKRGDASRDKTPRRSKAFR
jgi:ATP-dependent RNA helicase SUPV3L1/SUV3